MLDDKLNYIQEQGKPLLYMNPHPACAQSASFWGSLYSQPESHCIVLIPLMNIQQENLSTVGMRERHALWQGVGIPGQLLLASDILVCRRHGDRNTAGHSLCECVTGCRGQVQISDQVQGLSKQTRHKRTQKLYIDCIAYIECIVYSM